MYNRGKKNIASKWEKFANECSIGYWVFTIMAYFSFIQPQHFEQCEINFLKIETERAILGKNLKAAIKNPEKYSNFMNVLFSNVLPSSFCSFLHHIVLEMTCLKAPKGPSGKAPLRH